jgi:hypothetical protein
MSKYVIVSGTAWKQPEITIVLYGEVNYEVVVNFAGVTG